MQMELSTDTGMFVDDSMSAMLLLYGYSKYKKEREEQARRQQGAVSKNRRFINGENIGNA